MSGVGDFVLNRLDLLPDPCPFPENSLAKKKRTLVEKEKTIYAPFSGVGGIVYDKDAVYIDLGGSHQSAAAGKTFLKLNYQVSNRLSALYPITNV